MTGRLERAVIFAEKDGYRPLELDLYRGPSDDDSTRPLLLYVHGGGWRVSSRQRPPRETRDWTPTFFERLVDAGFVVAANDYRFSGEAVYPAAVEDTADALRFLLANAETLGVDPGRVVLFGQSAGGFLALTVGLTFGPEVRGVIGWYPLTDFAALRDDDPASDFPSQFLGAPLSVVPELAERSRVPRLARSDAPPVLLQHGTEDRLAPFDQSQVLRDALAAVGAAVELDVIEGAGHFFEGRADVSAIFQRAVRFARTCVGAPLDDESWRGVPTT